ncbi:MAG: hypothetical protein ACOVLC_11425 [Flavobacterium sp.]
MNTKKYLLSSLLAVLFLGFTSCSGDEEPVDPVLISDDGNNNGGGGNNGGGNTTVNGVYVLTAFNSSVPVDLNGDGVNSTNQLNETTCLNNSFLTLNLNNTFVATSKGIDIVFNVDGNGNETSEIECFEESPSNGTWSVQGNNVLFTYTEDGESFTDTFTKQGNNLVYTIEDGSVVGTSDNGEPVYLTATITLIYTKQ